LSIRELLKGEKGAFDPELLKLATDTALLTVINNNNNNDMITMLMPVKQNGFTHVRALLVLHGCGVLAQSTSVTGHYSSN
jgi:hypothetical protein